MKEIKKNNFDYNPFFLFKLQESWNYYANYKRFKFTDPKTYEAIKVKRSTEKISHRVAQHNYQYIDWNTGFQRIRDVNLKHNRSLSAIAKTSQSEIVELLKDKQVRYR